MLAPSLTHTHTRTLIDLSLQEHAVVFEETEIKIRRNVCSNGSVLWQANHSRAYFSTEIQYETAAIKMNDLQPFHFENLTVLINELIKKII